MAIKDKNLKEKHKIYAMTENEREEYIYSGVKNQELMDFAKDLQLKVIHAIGQRPIASVDDIEVADKRYLDAIEAKTSASKNIDENYSIEVELCDMARTVLTAVRWRVVTKIIGPKRRSQHAYEPNYYIDRLYKIFEIITKTSERIYVAKQNKMPTEYIGTLEYCYEQVIEKYFDFFLEGVGRALENNDKLTVNRLRIVCSLHAGLVAGKQSPKGKKLTHLADQSKILNILDGCIKAMGKNLET